MCKDGDSKCEIVTDGYNIESIACIIIGFIWLLGFGNRTARQLEDGGSLDNQTGWKVLNDSNQRKAKTSKNGKKTC